MFLEQQKRGWPDFLWESEISELYTKNSVTIMFMLQTDKHFYEYLIICQSEKR